MKKLKAFTLIELILTITILAILGTISFVSFGNFISSSRDSKRITDLGIIDKSISVYHIENGTIPLGEDNIEIMSGAQVISYQGLIKDIFLSTIKVSKEAYDPIEKDSYGITVDANKTSYQLIAYMEENKQLSFLNNLTYINLNNLVFSADYTKRYSYTRGQDLGTIFSKGKNRALSKKDHDKLDLSGIVSGNDYKIVGFLSGSTNNGGKTEKIKEMDLGNKNGSDISNIINNSISENKKNTSNGDNKNNNNTGNPITYSNCNNTTYNGYIIANLAHSQTGSFEKSISNGKNIIIATCNNGNLSYGDESLLCDINYVKSGNTCSLDTCSGNAPQYSQVNGIQGTASWQYSETTGVCKFKCQDGYTYKSDTNTCEKNNWSNGSFGACSATCGGGTQTRTVVCKDWNGNSLTDDKCNDSKSTTSQGCNTGSCYTYSWSTGSFGACSASPTWSSWSGCSATCGGGTQTRTCTNTSGTQTRSVVCQRNDGTTVSDSYCSGIKPTNSQNCTGSCSGVSSQSCNIQGCPTPISGVCGSGHRSCSSGISSGNSSHDWINSKDRDVTTYTWTCSGSNGGTDTNCTEHFYH